MKLSVKMLTFKHDNYIAQAINGVLMQVTDFDFELIISDDCSPDNTEQIVKDIQNSHPKGHLIKYLRQKKNIGVLPNGLFALQQCKGKYIAFCEGDDYWTDPNKLQQQVDILEKDENIGLVHTNYEKYIQRLNVKSVNSVNQKKITEGEIYFDLFKSNFIATLTVVARIDVINEALLIIKTKIPGWGIGDYPMWLYTSTKYKITYLPITTATYRVLSESASNTNSKVKKIKFYLNVLNIQIYFNKNIKSVKFNMFYAYITFLYSSIKLLMSKSK